MAQYAQAFDNKYGYINHHKIWTPVSPSLGDFPIMDRGSGSVPQGTIEFWSAGSANTQANPMRCRLLAYQTGFGSQKSSDYRWMESHDPSGHDGGVSDGEAFSENGLDYFALGGDSQARTLDEDLIANRPGGMAQMDWWHVAVRIEWDSVEIYGDGISLAKGKYVAHALDPSWKQELTCVPGGTALSGGGIYGNRYGQDELRLYRLPLPPAAIAAHAAQPRFWTAHPELGVVNGYDLRKVPSFTSPLYVMPRLSALTGAQWDGYVPKLVRDATDTWNLGLGESERKVPLKVELLLYPDAFGKGTPRVLVMPSEFWKSGGGWAAFQDEKFLSLRYRVSMDVSAVDGFNNETSVFDSIVLHYRTRKLLQLTELE